jgi:peptidoglycan-associated lipoprotein
MGSVSQVAQAVHDCGRKEHIMADVIRRNHLGAEERHRADEIHVHQRPHKRSWWPFAILALLAVGLMAIWSYARRHRDRVESRATVERVSPALPAPPPIERPQAPQSVAPPPALEPETEATGPVAEPEEPEATGPDSGASATEETEGMGAATGACTREFLFEANETALDAENEIMLKEFADCLKTNPSEAVALEGRADPRGSAEYNEGLAQRRAQSVADALIAAGVPAAQVTITIGEQVCSEATEACLQKNRSVSATSKR